MTSKKLPWVGMSEDELSLGIPCEVPGCKNKATVWVLCLTAQPACPVHQPPPKADRKDKGVPRGPRSGYEKRPR